MVHQSNQSLVVKHQDVRSYDRVGELQQQRSETKEQRLPGFLPQLIVNEKEKRKAFPLAWHRSQAPNQGQLD